MSKRNPFGDDATPARRRINPFGEEERTEMPADAAQKIEHAARKIRGLRSQMGAEGLTLTATRELIDEIAGALDAAARALRDIAQD
jgi:flagellin-like hook-associated protein FlgL